MLFQSLTSAMNTNGSVAGGNSILRGEGFEAALGEVYVVKDLAVGGLHGEKDFADALANNLFSLGIGGGFDGEILSPAFKGAVFSGATAVVIDDGVAKNPVEPGDGRLFVAKDG